MNAVTELDAENINRAAGRARLLSEILRFRIGLRERQAAGFVGELREIADHLVTAADELEDDARYGRDGDRPTEASNALHDARMVIEYLPAGLFPASMLGYVTTPVDGRNPQPEPVNALSPELAAQERNLRECIASVVDFLGDWDGEHLARSALCNLLDLHGEHERLAEEIAEDNYRNRPLPVTYRTADGKRSAEHATTGLTIFEGTRIIAVLQVADSITPGEVWALIANATA